MYNLSLQPNTAHAQAVPIILMSLWVNLILDTAAGAKPQKQFVLVEGEHLVPGAAYPSLPGCDCSCTPLPTQPFNAGVTQESLNPAERDQSAGIELKPLDGLKDVRPITHKAEVKI